MAKSFHLKIDPKTALTLGGISILGAIILMVELLQLTPFEFEGVKRAILFGGLSLIFAFESGIRFRRFSLKQFDTVKEIVVGIIALASFMLASAFAAGVAVPLQLTSIAAFILGILIVVNVIELFS